MIAFRVEALRLHWGPECAAAPYRREDLAAAWPYSYSLAGDVAPGFVEVQFEQQPLLERPLRDYYNPVYIERGWVKGYFKGRPDLSRYATPFGAAQTHSLVVEGADALFYSPTCRLHGGPAVAFDIGAADLPFEVELLPFSHAGRACVLQYRLFGQGQDARDGDSQIFAPRDLRRITLE